MKNAIQRRRGRFVLRDSTVVCVLFSVVCGFSAWAGQGVAPNPDNRLNIVLISLDTLRADHLSCYGYPRKTSPNIDRFARSAVRFTDCVSAIPLTLPSHVSMFTGLHAERHGVVDNGVKVPEAFEFVSETLLGAGYQTLAYVGIPILGAKFRLDQGFEIFREIGGGSRRRAEKTADTFIGWLERREDARPFFAFIHFYDIHGPYGAPGKYFKMFCRPDASDETPARVEFDRLRKEKIAQGKYVSDLYLYDLIGKYDGGIAYTDEQVGRILQALDAPGLEERTAIIITSDHGENLGGWRNIFSHGPDVYQETIRVPLLIRMPGMTGIAEICEAPTTLMDLAPTILELGSASPAAPMPDGRSLVPLVQSVGADKAEVPWEDTGRWARSASEAQDNLRRCMILDGRKFVLNDWTQGQALWGAPVNLPWTDVTRFRVFVKSTRVVSMFVTVLSDGKRQHVRSMATIPGSDPAASWSKALRVSESGWIPLTTPSFSDISGMGPAPRIESFVLNFGHASEIEALVDTIQVERGGEWITVESFDDLTEALLIRFLAGGAQVLEEGIVREHGIRSGDSHDGRQAEFISLAFPEHRFAKELYDLRTDPLEQVNLFQSDKNRALAMNERLLSFFDQARSDAGVTLQKEIDEETLEMLKALGYQ